MKTKLIAIATLALTCCASLAAEQPSTGTSLPEPSSGFYLSVFKATRYNNRGMMMTEIIGTLSDDPDTRVHMTCDVSIFSIGPDGNLGNQYAAYRNKPGQVKIQTREQGSQKIHEHTCKY